MRKRTMLIVAAALVLAACLTADAAGPKEPAPGVTVVYADGKKVDLKSLDVGIDDAGLFGSSFKKLKKLPVETEDGALKVPMNKLARIEFLSVDTKDEKVDIKVRLTAVDGKTMEGAIGGEQKVRWKGTHPFADSEIHLDPAKIKEIILRPAKKR